MRIILKTNLFIMLLTMFMHVQTVHAEQLTVGDFKKSCSSTTKTNIPAGDAIEQALEKMRCYGYVDGITDGLVAGMTLGKNQKLFCLPEAGLTFDGSLRMIGDFIAIQKAPNDALLRTVIAATYTHYFPCSK